MKSLPLLAELKVSAIGSEEGANTFLSFVGYGIFALLILIGVAAVIREFRRRQ